MRVIGSLCLLSLGSTCLSQDRLPSMPGYARWQEVSRASRTAVKAPDLQLLWVKDDLYFMQGGKSMKFATDKGKLTEEARPTGGGGTPSTGSTRGGFQQPARGRQFDKAVSADGKFTAQYKDQNIWLQEGTGAPVQLTSEGSRQARIKFGQASWVYGEELNVRQAMWFSPDSKYLAFYRFDESKVKDYFLAYEQTQFQDTLDTEAYPKAGTDNPSVDLMVYSFATKQMATVDVRFGDSEIGCYVYDVRWSPSGKEILFNRTNRKQNVLQFCAANPETGKCRVVVEERGTAWTENSPPIRWLSDGQRFIWTSERNGYLNFFMGNLDGSPLKPITQHPFEVAQILRVDEAKKHMYYMAHDGDNPYKLQLHLTTLDGRNERLLTDPAYSHTIQLGGGNGFFVDTYENSQTPPATCLRDPGGKRALPLGEADVTDAKKLGALPVERFEFTAADGKTKCYGLLHKPSNFDPSKKYPLLLDVYGGPESGSGAERYDLSQAKCEFGFLVAWIDGRGTRSRGYEFRTSVYGKLGVVEIDDQAAGILELAKRPYVDGSRVGISGTSYGGYSSVMAILRHPEVFAAAVACSPVTDWRHYDTIYTERYMGLPWENENKSGYDAGSAMTYADKLTGKLMIYFGSADNNVHPANTLMLAKALNRAGKGYSMMVGPDQGHTAIDQRRELEFFIDALKPTP